MKIQYKYIFLIILLFAIYHLFRDLLSNLGLSGFLIDIGHRPHVWCGQLCSWITIPPEILIILGSVFVLKRNRIGKIGILVLLIQPLWLLAWLLP